MDGYVYLAGGLIPTLSAAAMLYLRRDLAKITVIYGTIGGSVQIITEFLYVRDYWSPPTVLGTRVSVEDFIFGFGVTAFPVLLYPVLCRKAFVSGTHDGQLGVYLSFGAISAIVLFGGTLGLHLNSILLSCCLLGAFTLTVCVLRLDLVRAVMFTIVTTTSISIMLYVIVFDILAPDWWPKYWLLTSGPLGARVLGNVPVTEILCYLTWSGFAAAGHPFIFGKEFASVAAITTLGLTRGPTTSRARQRTIDGLR